MNCSFCRLKCWHRIRTLNIYLTRDGFDENIIVVLWCNGSKKSCEIYTNCRYLSNEHFQLIHLLGDFKGSWKRCARNIELSGKLDDFLQYVMEHIDFENTFKWLRKFCPYATEVMMDMFDNNEESKEIN